MLASSLLILLSPAAQAAPPPVPVPDSVPPSLRALSGILGRWTGRTEETWVPAGDVYFGVAFETQPDGGTFWEVLRVEEREGAVRLLAQPRGAPPVGFVRVAGAGLVVENPTHDFPTHIGYTWRGARLAASVRGGAGDELRFRWKAAPLAPFAPALEADRAFEADVAARGSAAWVEWFAPDGHHWDGERNLPAGAEMAAAMTGLLDGGARLRWEPRHSGVAPAGDLAFTVGDWAWSGPDGAAGPHGAYATVWRRQENGDWRVLYDVGVSSARDP